MNKVKDRKLLGINLEMIYIEYEGKKNNKISI
jgi:hypothetical protein